VWWYSFTVNALERAVEIENTRRDERAGGQEKPNIVERAIKEKKTGGSE